MKQRQREEEKKKEADNGLMMQTKQFIEATNYSNIDSLDQES